MVNQQYLLAYSPVAEGETSEGKNEIWWSKKHD